MTYTEIVNEICSRLNLTSTAAIVRVGTNVNMRNREVCASVGLDTSGRTTVTANTVVGNRSLVFPNTLKIFSIVNPNFAPPFPLGEVSFDELRNRLPQNDPPQDYAIQLISSDSVTVMLGSVPSTIYPLVADVLGKTVVLSGTMTPPFDENYHDILVLGVMATELDKMEKPQLASKKLDEYQVRLAEYRYFIAKSAYLSRYQGKMSDNQPWAATVPLV